uniref:Uncharacterized protein n=1 Tax=Aegilops tauschii subsp. strangulata TaxID=200361 RepID=A0A453GDF4_AEGTS
MLADILREQVGKTTLHANLVTSAAAREITVVHAAHHMLDTGSKNHEPMAMSSSTTPGYLAHGVTTTHMSLPINFFCTWPEWRSRAHVFTSY